MTSTSSDWKGTLQKCLGIIEAHYGKPTLRCVSQSSHTGEILRFFAARGYRVTGDDN